MPEFMDGVDLEKVHPRECPFCGEDEDQLKMQEFPDTGRFTMYCPCGGSMSGDSVREVLDAWDSRV